MRLRQETHELFVALIVHMCEHISMKNAIENFRLASGLSFQEIADRCAIRSRSTVLHHCRGSRLISAESAVKYSHGLGIPLSELRPDLWPPEEGQPPVGPTMPHHQASTPEPHEIPR